MNNKNIGIFKQIIDGIIIDYMYGKNDKGNFDAIDISDEYDIWMHLKNKESSHVIVRINKNFNIHNMNQLIKIGAELCKDKSKYKTYKNLEVIYTEIKNIKKTKDLGKVIINDRHSIKTMII
jgi:predicted ribosome quality control (RQC) complex YloA/Tae2 family protein